MSVRHLHLLRHAHSLEKQSGQTDFERELSPVGLQNSTRMGIFLSKEENPFDIIVCSPATRAITTAQLISEQLKLSEDKLIQNEDIYEASVRNLLSIVNTLKDEWTSVLLVGHNPAISYLAEYLTGEPVENMSTCGLVRMEIQDLSWSMVSEKTANFTQYIYPEKLNF